jgi:hypothetical protein
MEYNPPAAIHLLPDLYDLILDGKTRLKRIRPPSLRQPRYHTRLHAQVLKFMAGG